ncbi:uncharacterized protein BXZ73DRAFT_74702 [Epithele typhae]|uniref:uncharacterized protein n=1 Tax=Epithele typhae TaxID=378194 RepID=UPI002007778D|nr:uncharacterized protein BXZ73DRAFT_74702 [Epithele typhae]KAH9942446.1 hypothetical protein BXZ73DRAFT_74702 [Epithele typhae]
MALGGLGAILLSSHSSLSLGHVFAKVDLRSVFFALVFAIIVLVLAYLTNPSETCFRTYLTELSFKQHLSQLDENGQDDSSVSDDSGVHFTLSRRSPAAVRKTGSNFDTSSPFHFVSRASVSFGHPNMFFTVSASSRSPRSRTNHGHCSAHNENLPSAVSDVWYIGAFGRWWKGGVIQSWWHEVLANAKDAERCGSGLLDVKALDNLEGFEGLPLPTPSRLPADAQTKLRATERSFQRNNNNAPRSTTPPPLPKSASLPLHAPKVSTPPKANGHSPRHAPSPSQPQMMPEPSRPPAPSVLTYSPSSSSLWDSSPIIAEVLRQISQSKAAVHELRTQLADFRSSAADAHAGIQSELEVHRERKREDDAARNEIKTRTKTLEDSKRSAEGSKRDAEKRLRAAESARESAAARIERLGEEIGAMRGRMHDDEQATLGCKDEGDEKEQEAKEVLERKKKEIKVAEDVIAALNARAKELEEKIALEEEKLRRAKEEAEIKKQDRSFFPLTVVPTVSEGDLAAPAWSAYPEGQSGTQDPLTRESLATMDRQQPFPSLAPRSKDSLSSGSGSAENADTSFSPRPARLSLTAISNLREPPNRVLTEPDPNGQILLRPNVFPRFGAELGTSALSTHSTSTRFLPFDSDEPSAVEEPSSASSISPMSTSYIPASLIHSLDGGAGYDNVGLARSFQSEDDAILSRDWRKMAPFPAPPPVESPAVAAVPGTYTTSPQPSLTLHSTPSTRKTRSSRRQDGDRTPAVGVAAGGQQGSQRAQPGGEGVLTHPEVALLRPELGPSAPLAVRLRPRGPAPAALAPPAPTAHLAVPDENVFSSISMRAFAPSPAEREALQRALSGSSNTSLERLPTLSEVAAVPPSLPASPAAAHTLAAAPVVSGRMLLGGPALSWLSLPGPWEDEEPGRDAGLGRGL